MKRVVEFSIFISETYLSLPQDDPDLHKGSDLGRSLLLRALSEGNDQSPILKRLEKTFLHGVDAEDLARFVSDGCLFYKFISTELEKLPKHNEIIPGRHLICVELKDDAVKISALYDPKMQPQPLHYCTFGVFTEGG
jgi:hypothetical protein